MTKATSPSIRRVGLAKALALFPVLLALPSCAEPLPPPDLTEAEWIEIQVEYCTASDPGVVWTSTDRTVLRELRAVMNHAEPRYLTAIYPSYSNEIEIRLAGGQRWRLYYRDSKRLFTFHDPDEPVRSFRVAVTPDFYDRLSELLDEPIDVSRVPCRMPRYL